jgi:uncharacterized repeat protein (TIGR01451 family)
LPRRKYNYIYAIAGGGASLGDGGPATNSQTINTRGICNDPIGNIYLSDGDNRTVRKIDAFTGIITRIAGNGGSAVDTGDGGPATAAGIKPFSITSDSKRNIVFSEEATEVDRIIDAKTGIIKAAAGIGYGGGSSADGIPATDAHVSRAYVFFDAVGNLYIADQNRLREVNALTGIINTIAGNGTVGYSGDGGPAISASISADGYGMAFDAVGNFYFTENSNNVIRKIDAASGNIYTVAGNGSPGFLRDGGQATNAELSSPESIAIDIYGNLLIGDNGNNRIRIVNLSTGIIKTVVGTGTGGYIRSIPNGTPALSANIDNGGFFSLDEKGNLFLCGTNDMIYKITNFNPNVSSIAGMATDSFTVYQNSLCTGPQLYISTPHFSTAYKIITDFGDGTTDTTSITPYLMGGHATINHVYPNSGTFTINQTMYNGITSISSISYPYNYTFCRTLPVTFFYDKNGDCIQNTREPLIWYPTLTEVDSSGIPIDSLSATSGFNYDAYGAPGDIYQLKALPVSGNSFSCSDFVIDTLYSGTPVAQNKGIGISCNLSTDFDLSVNASHPISGLIEQHGHIYVTNSNCNSSPATVSMYFSPKYTFKNAIPSPSSVSGNNIVWNLSSLSSVDYAPFDIFYYLNASFTPKLSARDTVQSSISITPIIGDANPKNNIYIIIDTVRGGFDPNEMFVSPNGCIPDGTNQLQYSINFENTGNDTAFNIYVMDTLPGNVDPHSLRLVSVSAPMNIYSFKTNLYNIVKFDFPNINLLDSSHQGFCDGNVTFNIHLNNGISNGTVIFNHAGIFFDSNPVVMTNTVDNMTGCGILSVPAVAVVKTDVEIFPNPTNNELIIKMDNGTYSSFTISNSIGQVIMQHEINLAQTKVDVKTLSPGLYYIALRGDNGIKVMKFVKM